jgi:hypothetical protein
MLEGLWSFAAPEAELCLFWTRYAPQPVADIARASDAERALGL